jgi:hypothetical protein
MKKSKEMEEIKRQEQNIIEDVQRSSDSQNQEDKLKKLIEQWDKHER